MGPLRIILGLVLVIITGASMVSTLVLPRGKSRFQLVGLWTQRSVRFVIVAISQRIKDFERKDSVLAVIGPLALLSQLTVFLGLFLVGYSLAQWPYTGSYLVALRQAGSSMFTIGLAHAGGSTNDILTVMAAATGAIAIALQIGYLPAIYQAFNRREALVTLMEARAGLPAWGPELLARHQLVQTLDALPQLYRDWEMWSAEVAESHTSYPVLLYFRSPEPWYSWVLALLAVLDACAMQLALQPESAPSEARMCLRMGFTALRRLASLFRWEYDPDPLPDTPLQLRYDEFEYAVEVLAKTGFPIERPTPEAWPHFQGWRVNYESIAYRLADRVVAPRAPWSGDRRHLAETLTMPARPPHRAPDGGITDETKFRPDRVGGNKIPPSGHPHVTDLEPTVESLESLEVVPNGPLSGVVRAPASKSVTNRLLVVAALAEGTSCLDGVLRSDDTDVMMEALEAFGAGISDLGDDRIEVVGTGGRIEAPDAVVSTGLSGTTLRWLTAVALLAAGPVVLDGEAPLRRRPILPLVRALESVGARIETDEGQPPLRISSSGFRGGPVRVDAAESSQFATSLLLVAPYAKSDVRLEIANLGAAGYVDLTVEAMTRWGAVVRASGIGRFLVTAGRHYQARDETVEYDASAAAHLFALAMATGGSVTVANAVATRQPDAGIVAVFQQMGAQVAVHPEGGLTVACPGPLSGVDVDMTLMPDQVPTLAVLGALASGTTSLHGVSVSRGHETDRVEAITRELRRLGGTLDEAGDTLVVHGGHRLHGGVVDTYRDHRMAMALSSLAAAVPGVSIQDPGCVRKTYPGYWEDAATLGLRFGD